MPSEESGERVPSEESVLELMQHCDIMELDRYIRVARTGAQAYSKYQTKKYRKEIVLPRSSKLSWRTRTPSWSFAAPPP